MTGPDAPCATLWRRAWNRSQSGSRLGWWARVSALPWLKRLSVSRQSASTRAEEIMRSHSSGMACLADSSAAIAALAVAFSLSQPCRSFSALSPPWWPWIISPLRPPGASPGGPAPAAAMASGQDDAPDRLSGFRAHSGTGSDRRYTRHSFRCLLHLDSRSFLPQAGSTLRQLTCLRAGWGSGLAFNFSIIQLVIQSLFIYRKSSL